MKCKIHKIFQNFQKCLPLAKKKLCMWNEKILLFGVEKFCPQILDFHFAPRRIFRRVALFHLVSLLAPLPVSDSNVSRAKQIDPEAWFLVSLAAKILRPKIAHRELGKIENVSRANENLRGKTRRDVYIKFSGGLWYTGTENRAGTVILKVYKYNKRVK